MTKPASSTSRSTKTPRSSASTRRSQPSAPLGSLTQPGARDGVCCVACGSERVTRLGMTLTDGTPVSFTSCHRCEHRTWIDPSGRAIEREHVLDKARKTG